MFGQRLAVVAAAVELVALAGRHVAAAGLVALVAGTPPRSS
jgi:hypothetical protein